MSQVSKCNGVHWQGHGQTYCVSNPRKQELGVLALARRILRFYVRNWMSSRHCQNQIDRK